MKAPTFAKKIGRRRKSEEEEFNSERLQVDEDKASPTSIDTEAYDKFSSEDDEDDAFDDDKFSSEEDFFDDAASLSSTQDLAVMIEMTSKFHVLKLNEEGRLHCDVFGALNPAGSVIARSRSASINEGSNLPSRRRNRVKSRKTKAYRHSTTASASDIDISLLNLKPVKLPAKKTTV